MRPSGARLNTMKRKKYDLTIATWNIRTMLKDMKTQKIPEELSKFKIDVVALQEIRFQGKGKMNIGDFLLVYSGPVFRTGLYCTGFMINKRVCHRLLEYEPVNDRICRIRMQGRFRNVTLISAYAPTEDNPRMDIEEQHRRKIEFYNILGKICENTPKSDILIVLGDFNAKIGKESFMRRVAGKYTLHKDTSKNGKMLGQFAAMNNLIIKSTCFNHTEIRKGTWRTTRNGLNQIDHVLISARHSSNIIDVRTNRGPKRLSDHYLVQAILREKYSGVKEARVIHRKKWNVRQLREVNTEHDKDVMKMLQVVKENIRDINLEAGKEKIETEGYNRTVWFNNECAQAMSKKNISRQEMLKSCKRYCENSRKAFRLVRRKKKKWVIKKMKEMEQTRICNDEWTFLRYLERTKEVFQPRFVLRRHGQRQILERNEVLFRLFNSELVNERSETNKNNNEGKEGNQRTNPVEIEIQRPSYEEIEEVIENLKKNKAPGEDTVIAELLQHGENVQKEIIRRMINQIWDAEILEQKKLEVYVFDIWENREYKVVYNNVVHKIFSEILANKLNRYCEGTLGEYQCGFRPNRSTVDQIFVLREILDKAIKCKMDLHLLFMRYKEASHNIQENILCRVLASFGVPRKLINLIKLTRSQAYGTVVIKDVSDRSLKLRSGRRQKDTLSGVLFNIVLHDAMKNIAHTETIFHQKYQFIAYGEEIVLIGRNEEVLTEYFNALEEKGRLRGLVIDAPTTKYLKVSATEQVPGNFIIPGYTFQGVKVHNYLGVSVNSENAVSHEINERIMAGCRAYYRLRKLFAVGFLPKKIQVQIYMNFIRPRVTYAAETWDLKIDDEQALEHFERIIMSKIYGLVYVDDRRKITLDDNMSFQDILTFVKSRRTHWLKQVQEMDANRMAKKIQIEIKDVRKLLKKSCDKPKSRRLTSHAEL